MSRPWALSGGYDGSLRLWDLQDGHCFKEMCTYIPISCIAVDWTARIALSGGKDNALRLWNIQRGVCIREIKSGIKGHPTCVAVDWSSRLGLCGYDSIGGVPAGSVQLWDLASARCLQSFETEASQPVNRIEADWTRNRVLSGGGDQLRLWDLETGELILDFQGHAPIRATAVEWEAQLVLSGGGSAGVQLWDLNSASCVKELEPRGCLQHLSMAWDKQQAIGAGSASTGALSLWLWDLRDGACLRSIDVDIGQSQCVSLDLFHERGLCSFGQNEPWGNDDCPSDTLALLDLSSGECLLELSGHVAHVTCAVTT
eukprot:TRINITY_DN65444_c0_g1_i1.p1 TRINITY_DN65444_c0_g1~~TRINITY_DN65444_c0_g1_i1.p1  ORF type:complete len:327 (-),score=48.65 TRINITY_DN65444_c0_g1_i1:57-998(-)